MPGKIQGKTPLALVIDDDDAVRDTLCDMLEEIGLRTAAAEDGEKGIRLFKAEPPDVVVTDILMPVMEGIETIIRIRQIDPDVPIIAISGGNASNQPYLDYARKLGASRILEKPIRLQELTRALGDLAPSARREAD
ncbi:MAG: response regulator [Alphaproteobacteria bacterium]